MASLTRGANGGDAARVGCGDGERRSVRLGRVNAEVAAEAKVKVETLTAPAVNQRPADAG